MNRPLNRIVLSVRPLLILSLLAVAGLLSSCAELPGPEQEQVPKIERTFDSIALLPAQFTENQPDSFCHDDIGDELRSTMARHLRNKGYKATALKDTSPQSFALSPPPPKPGSAPELVQVVPEGYDAALAIWVDHYMATSLCESYGGGGALEISITVALYQLPGGEELGRWHIDEWTNSGSASHDAVWWILESLTKKSLAAIP